MICPFFFTNRAGPLFLQMCIRDSPRSAQDHSIIIKFFSRGLFKEIQEVRDGQPLFFFAAHIDNDAAGIHHDEAVAKTQGIPHIVRNHEACQMVPGNDFLRQGKDLFGRFWIKGRRVLIKKEQFRICLLYTSQNSLSESGRGGSS